MDNVNIESDKKFCTTCGEQILKEAEICPKCGVRQIASFSINASENKSLIGTILLTYFLGAIGVHYFYLGKVLKGILYLIFSSTSIPYILSFISLIGLTTSSIEKLNAKYGVQFNDCEKGLKILFLILAIITLVGLLYLAFHIIVFIVWFGTSSNEFWY